MAADTPSYINLHNELMATAERLLCFFRYLGATSRYKAHAPFVKLQMKLAAEYYLSSKGRVHLRVVSFSLVTFLSGVLIYPLLILLIMCAPHSRLLKAVDCHSLLCVCVYFKSCVMSEWPVICVRLASGIIVMTL